MVGAGGRQRDEMAAAAAQMNIALKAISPPFHGRRRRPTELIRYEEAAASE